MSLQDLFRHGRFIEHFRQGPQIRGDALFPLALCALSVKGQDPGIAKMAIGDIAHCLRPLISVSACCCTKAVTRQ